jgi:hypothetical protein
VNAFITIKEPRGARRSMSQSWRRALSDMPKDELAVGAVLLAVIGTFARNPWKLFDDGHLLYDHLGSEYYNIAVALVDGRGYSDPFAERTGPTAWMTPLYPALLAVLQLMLRDRALVAHAIVLSTVGALALVGVILFRTAKQTAMVLPAWVIAAAYVVWLWSFYFWFFFLTHDIWLHTLLVACITWSVHQYTIRGFLQHRRWGVLGGVAALTSPAIACAWLAFGGVVYLRSPGHRKQLLVSLAISACMVAPWVARNAWTFERLIPSKSNLMYEAYQANYRYGSGVYDNTWAEHPNASSVARFHYASVGEMTFIDEHALEFWRALRADPARYLRNVYERVLAVTVQHPDAGAYDPPWKMVIRRIVYPLPIASFILGMLAPVPRRKLLVNAAVPCAAYLVPYVLVAFYLRYWVPLTPALVFILFVGADRSMHALSQRSVLPIFGRTHRAAPRHD